MFCRAFAWLQDHAAKILWGWVLTVSFFYLLTGAEEAFGMLIAAPVIGLLALTATAHAAVLFLRLITRFLR